MSDNKKNDNWLSGIPENAADALKWIAANQEYRNGLDKGGIEDSRSRFRSNLRRAYEVGLGLFHDENLDIFDTAFHSSLIRFMDTKTPDQRVSIRELLIHMLTYCYNSDGTDSGKRDKLA